MYNVFFVDNQNQESLKLLVKEIIGNIGKLITPFLGSLLMNFCIFSFFRKR